MMLKTNGLLFALGGVLLMSAPAAGQVSAPREAAQIQFGVLSLYPSLQIVDAGIDDNVFNDTVAPQSDYTLTVASRLLAVVRLGSNELLFQSGNDYVWFQDIAAERSSNAQYAVRLNLSASRFKPFIGAERVRTRQRRGFEIDARARLISRALLTGLAYDVSPRTALTASVRYDEENYEDGERFRGVALDEALNRTGRAADAGMRYAVTPLTTLSVTAGYEEERFESHIRDVKRYRVGPTLEFSPEAAIRGRVEAAVELFKPVDPALAQSTGLAYLAALNWTLFGRTTFDLGAGRNISYSYQETEPFYLLTNAKLAVSQPLPGWFEFYGGYEWDHMAYRWRRGADAAVGQLERVDRVDAASGGVGIRFGRGFSVRLGIEKTRRRSVEEPLQNFNRTRFLSTVTVGS